MGESGPDFVAAVRKCGTGFQAVKTHVVAALPVDVHPAHAEAKPSEVIHFSLGAPSFDEYANSTARGRHFTELVNSL